MRIVHIITRLIIGGAQENTLLTCHGLMRSFGDDVLLITGPGIGPEGSLVDQARSLGIPTRVLDSLRRSINPAKDWLAYQQIRDELKDFHPDVVHTHSAKAGLLGREAAWRLGVPAVLHTVHGAPFHPYQNPLSRSFFHACERYASKHCHQLISVADAMTDLLVAARVAPPSKFTKIYSGMDVAPFLSANENRTETRRQLGLNEQHVVLGKVARLFQLKGHEYLIESARSVVCRNPHVRFLLVGDGVLRDKLWKKIARSGLMGHFIFTGLLPPEELPRYLGAMDILIHTSLREGLARVLPQALIAEKPVISYDVDGAREVVIPDETGILLPPKSVAELADAINRLTEDVELRQRLGAEGRKRFTDLFRHEQMTKSIRALYARLLA